MSNANDNILLCDACRVIGPVSCASCRHNLDLIIKLQLRIEVLEKRGADMERDFLLERDRCSYAQRQLEMIASSSSELGLRLNAVIRRIEVSHQDGTPL